MNAEQHPLDSDDREKTVTHEDVDVRATISADGKRVRLTVTDQDGDRERYQLRGLTLNGTPIRAGQPLSLYGVDAVIEWQNGGLGLYPGVNVIVSRDD
ncbi:outer membrane lipoprotein carrier protein LolA [Natronosalvus rutilus]|uniref:Outer membrane lipoprotein carrier protein LolA n=1 Tax=Natronosalvus rutilus TaxID=2953753 RepID=A0A9E7SZJ0_9EURY|nr:outer membrane lipoprotein carrier protein LolA [Natronosalvus rutilus]UTF55963.1 outer membrane lipoprotein carrier protein LolA [Natronosalvus rutilus]